MPETWQKLLSELEIFNGLEIIAVITALIYVALAAIGNRWCFLFGLISSTIYVYITFKLNFFFDVGINIYYVIMSFFGWFVWSVKPNQSSTIIKKTSAKRLGIAVLIGLSFSFILAYSAERFSSAELPYLDAFTTVFAIIATFMVVQKQIENWLIWIVVDCVAAGMYFHKELYFTSLLFVIYTIVAVFGYLKWKKLLEISSK